VFPAALFPPQAVTYGTQAELKSCAIFNLREWKDSAVKLATIANEYWLRAGSERDQ